MAVAMRGGRRPWRLTVLWLFFFSLSGILAARAQPAPVAPIPWEYPIVPAKPLTVLSPQPQWVQLWEQGRTRVREHDLAGALPYYQQARELHRDNPELVWELARICMALGLDRQASTLLEAIRGVMMDRFPYRYTLAESFRRDKKYAAALPLYRDLVAESPGDPALLVNFIQCLRAEGHAREAYQALQAYYKLRPKDLIRRRQLAELAVQLKEWEAARPHIDALLVKGHNVPALLELAVTTYSRLGLLQRAAELLRHLLALQPKNIAARKQLASLYSRQGEIRLALEQLQLIARSTTGEPEIYLRIAELLQQDKQQQAVIPWLEKYLAQRPGDKEALQRLIAQYARLGNRQRTLELLEQYFAVEDRPETGKLRQAAALYEAAGRYREALPLYRRLLDNAPDDPELLAIMADDLLHIGEHHRALSVLQHLARVAPRQIAVRRSLVALLEEQERWPELARVLSEIVALDSADLGSRLRLAEILLQLGNVQEGRQVAEGLADQRFPHEAGQLRRRARVYAAVGNFAHALADYQTASALDNDSGAVAEDFQNVLQAAGLLGLVALLDRQQQQLQGLARYQEDLSWQLRVADAYRAAGALSRAAEQYRQLLTRMTREPAAGSPEIRWQVSWALSSVLLEQGDPYAAEQELRQAMFVDANHDRAARKLGRLALRDGRVGDAVAWFSLVTKPSPRFGEDLFDRVLLLDGQGEHDEARQRALELAEGLGSRQQAALIDQLVLPLARLFLHWGEPEEAVGVLEVALPNVVDPYRKLAVEAVLIGALERLGQGQDADRYYELSMEAAGRDRARLAYFARQLIKAQSWDRARAITQTLSPLLPDSLSLQSNEAAVAVANGRWQQAEESWQQLATAWPQEKWLWLRCARAAFKSGHYDRVLACCRALLAGQPGNMAALLLQARTFWSLGRWEEARQVYERICRPDVGQLYADANKDAAAPVAKQTWFHWPGEPAGAPEQSALARALSPENMSVLTKAHLEAASLTARFRWQQRAAKELAARRAVLQGEYYRAVRLYRDLLNDQPTADFFLFDLAGVLSRLGRLGEEAAIYDLLAQRDFRHPGLAAARQRNALKRRPRAGVAYGSHFAEGRGGRVAMEQNWVELSTKFSPLVQHEFTLNVRRSRYRPSTGGGESVHGRRLFGAYEAAFARGLVAQIGGGVERIEHQRDAIGLVRLQLSGDLGDAGEAYFSYDRDLAIATVTSITQRITRQRIEAGGVADLVPRWQVGGDYRVSDFSDGNITEGYSLWSSYLLHREPDALRLTYQYDYLDSRESSYPGLLLDGSNATAAHPYWTPKNYWLNKFSVYFKHLLDQDPLERAAPQFYTVQYTLGHDSDGHPQQTIAGNLVYEVNARVVVRAGVEMVASKRYDKRDGMVQLLFRW